MPVNSVRSRIRPLALQAPGVGHAAREEDADPLLDAQIGKDYALPRDDVDVAQVEVIGRDVDGHQGLRAGVV